MTSLFDLHVQQTIEARLRSPEFKSWLGRRVLWSVQGFADGFDHDDRERFTTTVARRIWSKAREPVYLFGRRIWRKRFAWQRCCDLAEQIVVQFIRDSRVKFGDPAFDWTDGRELADDDMSYWERCP